MYVSVAITGEPSTHSLKWLQSGMENVNCLLDDYVPGKNQSKSEATEIHTMSIF
jgi:hypothetical protein